MSKIIINRIVFLVVSIIIMITAITYCEAKQIENNVDILIVEEKVEDIVESYVEDEPEEQVVLTPMGAKSKTYMDYSLITNVNTEQWRLLQTLTICDDGMLRDNDGYIAAALGSAFGPIGSRYVFTLEDGKELMIIKADQKQDNHTCENNIFGLGNWDIIEFIVDTDKMPIYPNGYVYGGNFDNCPEYAGDVVNWVRVD